MKCNQCNATMINKVFCHESGCPNYGKKWNDDSQEFMTVYTCEECGSEYFYPESLELCCQFIEEGEEGELESQ